MNRLTSELTILMVAIASTSGDSANSLSGSVFSRIAVFRWYVGSQPSTARNFEIREG